MKKIYLFLLLLYSANNFAQYVGSTTVGRSSAHNLIYNNGFETADAQGVPDNVGQADRLESWEDRKSDPGNVHSPDWIYNGLQSPIAIPTPASGKGMIDMGNYELIQQDFKNEDMKGGELYVVSMYIYIPTLISEGGISNSSLNCYLGENRFKYKSEDAADECTPDYTDYKTLNQRILIASWNISSAAYPNVNGWTKITQVFRAPANVNFWDFFMIDLRQNDYDPAGFGLHCKDGFVFIDEVSLEEVDQCGKTCSPNLGAIQYSTIPNAIIANDAPGFTMLIKDAMGINFTVFDSGGLEIYNQNAYDPNGLVDAGYSDYYFSWTGQKPDGSLFPEDVYVYQLRLWNCKYDQTYTNSLTYLVGSGGATQGYDIKNTQLIDCCPQFLEIQDKEYYSGTTIEKADVSITAGENFTTSFPIGPVICHSGSDVVYVSNTINLLTGFSVESGAQFDAIATGICPEQYVRSMSRRERGDISQLAHMNLQDIAYSISSNPSNDGLFTITTKIDYNSMEKIGVYNILGELVVGNITPSNSFNIDLSNFSKGMYFLKVKLKNNPTQLVNKLIYN